MDTDTPLPRRISLGAISLAFLRLGCTSFGGGTAGWIHREFVLRRRWIDDAEFLAVLSVGQALPGANGIKTATLIGDRLHGWLGASIAVLSLLAGPFAIILVVGALYSGLGDQSRVHVILDGVAAAAVGLTLATGARSAAHGAPDASAMVMLAATILGVGVFRWPMLPVMLVLAPISVAMAFRRRRQN
jgi:chromate transporter